MVGRGPLVERITALLRANGGATLIGPAGIGKTALARHLAAQLATDFDALWIAGTPAAADIPLAAFAAFLPPTGTEPGLASLVHVRHSVATTTSGRPRLLLVDDAHALDETSAALVHQLALGGLAIVMTQRTGAVSPESVSQLWRSRALERIDVEPLDVGAVGELAAEILHGEVDPASAHDVWLRSSGNPLYARELVVDSHAAGEWTSTPIGWRWAVGDRATPRLTDLLRSRLDRLTEVERDVLTHLAFGEPMGLGEFEHMCDDEVLEGLERQELIAAELDRRRISVRFAHPLHAEVIRRSVTPLRARAVRQSLARTLRATGARRRDDLMRLSVLAIEAGTDIEPALLVDAARQALAGDEHSTALRLAQAAFEQAPDFSTGRTLADVLAFDGRLDEIASHWRVWAETAESQYERGVVTMHRASSLYYRASDPEGAFALLDEERATTPPGQLADEYASLAAALRVSDGQIHAGLALAGPLLERPANGRIVAQAALATALGMRALGLVDDAARVTAESIRTLQDHDGADALIPKSVFSVVETSVMVTSGRFDDAARSAERSIELARSAGALASEGLSHMFRAEALAMLGRFDDASTSLARADSATVNSDRPMYRSWVMALRAAVAALAGDHELAAASLAERSAIGPHPSRLAAHHAVITQAILDREIDPAAATTRLIAEAQRFADAGDIDAAIRCAYELIRLDVDEYVDDLTRWAATSQSVLHQLMAAHGTAVAQRDVASLAAAADGFAACGANVYAVRAARQAAELAERQSDGPRAAQLRMAATTWERRFQGVWRTDSAAPATGDARPDDHRPHPGTGVGLTRREREIALLASQGLASRAIGDRLFLSPRTVDNHLAKAYAKLGVKRRAELAHVLATR